MDIHIDDISLRPWKEEDAERLAVIANNKKIFDNLRDAFPYPYSLEDAKEFISSVQTDDGRSKVLAIEMAGEVVGSIGAFLQSDVYRKNAEIGYFLAEEQRGKGIMTKSIRALVRYLFANTDVIRVYAEPFARNTGSRRALKKRTPGQYLKERFLKLFVPLVSGILLLVPHSDFLCRKVS